MILPTPSQAPDLRAYHGIQGRWSSSRLKTLRKDPYLAFGLYVASPRLYAPDPPTSAQTLGTSVHELLRFAAEGNAQDAYGPAGPLYKSTAKTRRDAAWKREWHAFPDKLVLTAKEREDAHIVADAILKPRTKAGHLARALLTGPEGYSEYYNAWTDERGVAYQQLLDRFTVIWGQPAYVEIKTAEDPSPWAFFWQLRSFGYDDQMAFNLSGLAQLLGEEPLGLWVVVGTKPSHQVAVYPTVWVDPHTGEVHDEVLGGSKGRKGRPSARTELVITQDRLAGLLEDQTGAEWCQPWERLEDGTLPQLGV